MNDLKKCAEVLIAKAAKTDVAVESLQFSQAACNVANAMAQLLIVENSMDRGKRA